MGKQGKVKTDGGKITARKAVRSDRLLSFAGEDDDDDDDDDYNDDDKHASSSTTKGGVGGRKTLEKGKRKKQIEPTPVRKRLRPVASHLTTVRTDDGEKVTERKKIKSSENTKNSEIQKNEVLQVKENDKSSSGVNSGVNSGINSGNASSIMEAANAEYEALKRQLLGDVPKAATEKGHEVIKKLDENNEKDSENKTSKDEDKDKNPEKETEKSGRRRRKQEEDEVMSKLEAFEQRLLHARKGKLSSSTPTQQEKEKEKEKILKGDEEQSKGAMPDSVGNAAWFVRGLRLGPPDDDEREYDVIDLSNVNKNNKQKKT